jgi:hypothetical protein
VSIGGSSRLPHHQRPGCRKRVRGRLYSKILSLCCVHQGPASERLAIRIRDRGRHSDLSRTSRGLQMCLPITVVQKLGELGRSLSPSQLLFGLLARLRNCASNTACQAGFLHHCAEYSETQNPQVRTLDVLCTLYIHAVINSPKHFRRFRCHFALKG